MCVAEKKILIVDDDPVARHTLHTLLKSHQYETAVAGDAMAALTQARNHKPDLIILDLGLPAGGGFTFLQRVRAFPALSLIPIVVISGHDRATNEPRALEAGAAYYIEKPAKNEDVVAIVKRLLEED